MPINRHHQRKGKLPLKLELKLNFQLSSDVWAYLQR
jgi:hypothetical protein